MGTLSGLVSLKFILMSWLIKKHSVSMLFSFDYRWLVSLNVCCLWL